MASVYGVATELTFRFPFVSSPDPWNNNDSVNIVNAFEQMMLERYSSKCKYLVHNTKIAKLSDSWYLSTTVCPKRPCSTDTLINSFDFNAHTPLNFAPPSNVSISKYKVDALSLQITDYIPKQDFDMTLPGTPSKRSTCDYLIGLKTDDLEKCAMIELSFLNLSKLYRNEVVISLYESRTATGFSDKFKVCLFQYQSILLHYSSSTSRHLISLINVLPILSTTLM